MRGTKMIYREESAEFSGDACSLTGVAVYDVAIEDDYSADVGGVDGLSVMGVELLYVDMDGYRLPASAVEQIIGSSAMERVLDGVAEAVQENIADYAIAAE
ncbi:hypothetical protein ACSSNL_18650 [Thalassobius sp. S69A]